MECNENHCHMHTHLAAHSRNLVVSTGDDGARRGKGVGGLKQLRLELV